MRSIHLRRLCLSSLILGVTLVPAAPLGATSHAGGPRPIDEPSAEQSQDAGPTAVGVGEYPPEGGTFEIDPSFVACGTTVTGTGSSWQPGSVVVFTIGGKTLGTVQTATDGSFSTTFILSDSLEVGDHVITAQGFDPSGNPAAVSTSLTVTKCGTEVAGIAVFRGKLPFTGSDRTGVLVGGSVLLILVGTALGVAFRRRHRLPFDIS